LVVLVTVLAAAGCAVKSNTLNALLAAAKALDDKDYKTFNKYVNVDRIVDQCVTLLLEEAKAYTKKPRPKLWKLGEKFARPHLVEMTKEQFRRAVEDGTVAEQIEGLDKLPSSRLMFNLVGLFGVAHTDSSTYEIGEVTETKNGESLKLKVKYNGEWLPLELRAKKVGDHYRIVEVENLHDVAGALLKDLQDD